MSSFFKLIAVFLLISFSTWHTSHAQVISLGNAPTYYFTGNSWACFSTYDSTLKIPDIIAYYRNRQFKSVGQKVLNAGIPDKYYWFHFTVQNENPTNQNFIINIESPRLHDIELFEISHNQYQSLGKLGNAFIFKQRAVLNKNFAYKINLKKNEIKEYYLYVNQIGHTFILPVTIHSEKGYQEAIYIKYLLDGISYGILLFVAILSFYFFINNTIHIKEIFIAEKNPNLLYFYYTLYILSAILWFLSYFELGFETIWFNYPNFNLIGAPFFASLNILLNIQISQILLKLKKNHHGFYKLGNLSKWLLLLVAVYPIFHNLEVSGYRVNSNYLYIFLSIIILGICTLFISVVSLALKKGFSSARYYFIASFFKVGSILNLAFLELGISPGMYYLEGFLQIGILVEITLLSYALIKKYTSYKTSTVENIIQAQEDDKIKFQKNLHDSVLNNLSLIKINIHNMKHEHHTGDKEIVNDLDKLLKDIYTVETEARFITEDLMPEYISNNSITEIIWQHKYRVENFLNKKYGKELFTIEFSCNDEKKDFNEGTKLNIFRIMQELISNSIKHANCKRIAIVFSFTPNELTIIVQDDGVGFNKEEAERKGGIGLKSIRSRIDFLTGSFVIDDTFKGRTLILISIPYNKESTNKNIPYDF